MYLNFLIFTNNNPPKKVDLQSGPDEYRSFSLEPGYVFSSKFDEIVLVCSADAILKA